MKVKIIKTPDLGYRGCAEPKPGTIGVIDEDCKIEYEYQKRLLKDMKTYSLRNPLKDIDFTMIKFTGKALGYVVEDDEDDDPIILAIPNDCFEELK